jgi:hypothetical protein
MVFARPGRYREDKLIFHGATLNNPDGDALILDGAQVTGDMLAGGGFHAHGEVHALQATIGGLATLWQV